MRSRSATALAELDIAVDAGGKSFKLKSLKGSGCSSRSAPSWCKPCAKELPAWDKLAPEFKGKVTFVAINIDDDIDDGKKFNKKLKLKNLTLVYMPADKWRSSRSTARTTMPTTFVADPQGVFATCTAGFEKGDASGETKKMREQLDKLVK